MVKIWRWSSKTSQRYEQMNVKMSPYIFYNFSTGSLRHEPVHLLQKMYGDIFNFNCSYLWSVAFYSILVKFSVLLLFLKALFEYVIQIKQIRKKDFLWRHTSVLYWWFLVDFFISNYHAWAFMGATFALSAPPGLRACTIQMWSRPSQSKDEATSCFILPENLNIPFFNWYNNS